MRGPGLLDAQIWVLYLFRVAIIVDDTVLLCSICYFAFWTGENLGGLDLDLEKSGVFLVCVVVLEDICLLFWFTLLGHQDYGAVYWKTNGENGLLCLGWRRMKAVPLVAHEREEVRGPFLVEY